MGNKFVYGLLGVSILVMAFGVFLIAEVYPSMSVSPSSESIDYGGMACIYKNGELVGCDHNVLYYTGMNMTRDLLGGGTGGAITNISLCNATTGGCGEPVAAASEAWTALEGCMDDFNAGTYAALGQNGNWTITKTFVASCDDVETNITRLGNATTYFAGANFSDVILQDNDQLTVTWTLQVS